MALMNCSECNKEISDKAATCIGCGCPIAEVDNPNTVDVASETSKLTPTPVTSYPSPFATTNPTVNQTASPQTYSSPMNININLDAIMNEFGQNRMGAVKRYMEVTGLIYADALLIVNNAYDKRNPSNYQAGKTNTSFSRPYINNSSGGVKTAKMIVGIISIVFFMIITFQSCTVGIVNIFEANTDDSSGAAGFFLAFTMLIGGIVGIATRNSKGGGITAGIFYLLGSIIGFVSLGTYGDLAVWSVLALLFSVLFILGSVEMAKSRVMWGILLLIIGLLAAFSNMAGNDLLNLDIPSINAPGNSSIASISGEGEDESSSETQQSQDTGEVSFGDTFQFNGSSGQIEITFGTTSYWGEVENEWSDNYGESVFGIPVTIKNLSSTTGGLNPFDFTMFGSDGLKLDSIGSSFDYDIAWESNMRAGASQSGLFYFHYKTDGEYIIEFTAGFGFGDSRVASFMIEFANEPSISEFDINMFPPSTFVALPTDGAYKLGDSFDFSGSSGDVRISFGTSFVFSEITNNWSDHFGKTVFSIPVSVTNIDNETGGLNPFDFDLYGSNGLKLGSVGSSFDDDITWEGDMRPGATMEGSLYFLYVGDGQYTIEFAAGFGFGDRVEVIFDVIK
ncbi:MAG: DUF4352 domain-containing protein [Oscillospiraceae bacterium]|jgi:hypothetical protein|nr:DUF4352 domain-containing protein [Oscillospiraceae bacterium]